MSLLLHFLLSIWNRNEQGNDAFCYTATTLPYKDMQTFRWIHSAGKEFPLIANMWLCKRTSRSLLPQYLKPCLDAYGIVDLSGECTIKVFSQSVFKPWVGLLTTYNWSNMAVLIQSTWYTELIGFNTGFCLLYTNNGFYCNPVWSWFPLLWSNVNYWIQQTDKCFCSILGEIIH